MKKIILASAIFSFFFQSIAFCQTGNDVIASAVTNLKTLLTNHMIEKAYLQFDRPYPYYVAGEIVYFKAYVVMGERHEPSTISNILHVDLIDKNDVLMQSISLQLTNGTGWGDFALPDTLQKGSYRIRAYTEWMRNDQHPYFFDQYLSVSSINGIDRVAENSSQSLKPDLQFFPEGGNLIADNPSNVAFKAIGTNGLAINVKGVVVDDEHKEVAKITTMHQGMGVFNFLPEDGRTYKAMVTFADGSQSTVALPAAQPKGITLTVNTDDPSKVSIEIRANRTYFKENLNKQFNLLLYYAGSLKRYAPKLDNKVLDLNLPASAFPTGILKVTLLSGTGDPLNERLVFIQNPDLLNLTITANKPVFAPRENVQLSLGVKNKDGNPVIGSFSVSVVDESKILVDENAENSILSNLLLTSEVKGYIEKPNFYFSNVTKETRADLDILMLTQGYRRFEWKEMENASAPEAANAYNPEKGMDISGMLKTHSGEPISDCTVTLFPQPSGDILTQVTDKEGKFRFSNVDVSSGAKFILKTSSSGKNAVLTLNKPAGAPDITTANPIDAKYNANADLLASLLNTQKPGVMVASNGSATVLLKEDKYTTVNRNDNYRSSNLGGPGHADQVIMGDEIKNSLSLSIGLNGRLVGVQFNGGIPLLTSSIVFSGLPTEGVQPMLIIVDGTDMGTTSIDVINPQDVETVELLKGSNAAIYGVEGAGGVLVITTRAGGVSKVTESKEMSPGIFSIEPAGFYKAREFYSPRYAANQPINNLPDQRTTIFWKPDVITDAAGNASFNFFNADGKGSYRVEVEGIDGKGNLGMQVFRYKVE